MTRFKKILITVGMILVWGWTIFMGTFVTNVRGRVASWTIGILINVLLALYYSYIDKRPKSIREWFDM